jgi:hypothetical protein
VNGWAAGASFTPLRLPWRAWSGGLEEEIFDFPSEWTVERLKMVGWGGENAPDVAGLREAVRRLAAPRASVSIAFDDLTRPTPLGPVLEAIAGALGDAGVPDSQIDLVMATGAHGPPRAQELRWKVGDAVAGRFQVRVHRADGDLADSGIRLGALPVRIDRRFLAADLRIGVGTVMPNPFAGFSGGGKIVLPGLASLEVLEWLHKLAMMGFAGGVAKVQGNRIREETDRVAAELPLHFVVACLVDSRRRLRELHYGDPAFVYDHACERARRVYATPMSGRYDALICNAYPKDGEFLQAENAYSPLRTGGLAFLAPEGSVVLMAACHKGRGHHSLFDRGMPLHRPAAGPKAYLRGAPGCIYAPGIREEDCRVNHWEGYPHFRDWGCLISELRRRHGDSARIGVFPAASCQLGPGGSG